MDQQQQPDIFVSIDLGTTFTGAAWMTPKNQPQVINDWPGSGDRSEHKVPTTLIYNPDGSVSSWGFLCEDDDTNPASGKIRREFFKIFIDEPTLVAAQQQGFAAAPRTTDDAKRYVVDFLRLVYAHVKQTVEVQTGRRFLGGWQDQEVLFLFSVPTTWGQEVTNIFKGIIREAGFGTESPRHSAQVDLTEAEAAAVATLKTSFVSFTTGNLFLSVDAGGGTTDLALMAIESTDTTFPQMKQKAAVRGIGIGASLIDVAFSRLVAQRLAPYPEAMAYLPGDFIARMARSKRFRTVKHKFGESVYMQNVFKMPMEGVAHDFTHQGIGAENGHMVFSKEEISGLFDVQIEGIMGKIREQLDWVIQNGHTQPVVSPSRKFDSPRPRILEPNRISITGAHHALGGLGNSHYVRECIQQQLSAARHPSAPSAIVIPCQDPQLVVVKGILYDRQQRMESGGKSVLSSRIARASYGVVVRQVYSAVTHFDEDIVEDEYDKSQRWAINQIHWLIKKGDSIDPNSSLSKAFEIRLSQGESTRSWNSQIVVSHNEASFLPRSLKQAGATKLCSVKSNLSGVEQHQLILKQKRGTCFSRGYTFYICRFDVRVIVAPADLRFELWFGGIKFSGNHEPIAVTWDAKETKVG